jgi:glycosyltransferase
MKVSIITSVYNNKHQIKQAIDSVLSQSYENIEYIIIDGASTDGTINIIKSYKDKISKFISEPDEGIYSGLNKGIDLATGDIIGFLHSDDFYVNSYVIENIMKIFNNNECDGVYGDLIYVDKKDTDKIIRYWKSGEFEHKNLKKGWMPPHPAFFVKKEIYNKFGYFDTDFKIAADYNFMLKILIDKKIRIHYLPKVLYVMRVGGKSNKSLKNIWQKSKEDLMALKRNRIGGIRTLIKKNISKIYQFGLWSGLPITPRGIRYWE